MKLPEFIKECPECGWALIRGRFWSTEELILVCTNPNCEHYEPLQDSPLTLFPPKEAQLEFNLK